MGVMRAAALALLMAAAFTVGMDAQAPAPDAGTDGPSAGGLAQVTGEAPKPVGGADPWPYGLAANRKNLERFLQLEYDQGLISKPMKVEDIFFHSTLKT